MTDAKPVRERPIIFSGPMVRAILEGRKSQTRRVLKPQPNMGPDGKMVHLGGDAWAELDGNMSGLWKLACPGDRLWVRETWAPVSPDENWRPIKECNIEYRADDPNAKRAGGWDEAPYDAEAIRWRSPIHMPRWASRITLDVTEVRVQRLQDISCMDAMREGVTIPAHIPQDGADLDWARRGFRELWQSLHSPGSWDANPWVAAITFKRIKP